MITGLMTVLRICILAPGLVPRVAVDRVAGLGAALHEWKSSCLPTLLPASVALVLAPLCDFFVSVRTLLNYASKLRGVLFLFNSKAIFLYCLDMLVVFPKRSNLSKTAL